MDNKKKQKKETIVKKGIKIAIGIKILIICIIVIAILSLFAGISKFLGILTGVENDEDERNPSSSVSDYMQDSEIIETEETEETKVEARQLINVAKLSQENNESIVLKEIIEAKEEKSKTGKETTVEKSKEASDGTIILRESLLKNSINADAPQRKKLRCGSSSSPRR